MEIIFKGNITMWISSAITALSTLVIAYFTCQNHKMYKLLRKKDEEYKKQTKDLYHAIVISTLLSGPSSTGGFEKCKETFKKEYRGETKIFRDG